MKNRKYLMKQMDESENITEETWVLCDLISQIEACFDEIETLLIQKEWDPKKIELLKYQLNCEEQITTFIQFIQKYNSFQEHFRFVQTEAKRIAEAIDLLKAQPSNTQDPLPGKSLL